MCESADTDGLLEDAVAEEEEEEEEARKEAEEEETTANSPSPSPATLSSSLSPWSFITSCAGCFLNAVVLAEAGGGAEGVGELRGTEAALDEDEARPCADEEAEAGGTGDGDVVSV